MWEPVAIHKARRCGGETENGRGEGEMRASTVVGANP